jgi:hypothetical protein
MRPDQRPDGLDQVPQRSQRPSRSRTEARRLRTVASITPSPRSERQTSAQRARWSALPLRYGPQPSGSRRQVVPQAPAFAVPPAPTFASCRCGKASFLQASPHSCAPSARRNRVPSAGRCTTHQGIGEMNRNVGNALDSAAGVADRLSLTPSMTVVEAGDELGLPAKRFAAHLLAALKSKPLMASRLPSTRSTFHAGRASPSGLAAA